MIATLAILLAASLAWSQIIPASAPGSDTATLAERATAWTTLTNFDRTVWTDSSSNGLAFARRSVRFRIVGTPPLASDVQTVRDGRLGGLPGSGRGERDVAGLALLFAGEGR